MPIDTRELTYIVQRILSTYHENERWPSNIIDQVFHKIYESEYVYRKIYFQIVGHDKTTQNTVNQNIGKIIKDLTKLETVRENVEAVLGKNLIRTYTELGPKTNGND